MVEENKARASETNAADALKRSRSVTENASLRLAEAESSLNEARFQIDDVSRHIDECGL